MVHPGPVRAVDVTIEPDLSNAAPFLAAARSPAGRVTVRGWPRTHHAGRRPAARDPRGDGCPRRALDDAGLTVHRPTARSRASSSTSTTSASSRRRWPPSPRSPTTPSRLRGVAHIRGHETDRLAALATELQRLGGDVTELPDGLEIRPRPLHGGVFRTYADHRMAHAAVVLGLAVPGVLVEDVATTAKTFPDFAAAWSALVGG